MHFDEAVQYLLGLGNEILTMKLGLRNTELLFESLGHPERKFRSVQIAGTNGKGSVSVILDSICLQAGIKTGCYTSPHLTSITERIHVEGIDISRQTFARHATIVRDKVRKLLTAKALEAVPTFFEQVTAIAMSAFAEAGIDLAILETGMGGRLDSTTAASAQLLAITPIALDHQQYLGNTLTEIASEKAAIIRGGTKVVVGPQPEEALSVIIERCEAHGVVPSHDTWKASVDDVTEDGQFCVTLKTDVDTYEALCLGLLGKHQIENTATAVQLAEQLRTFGFRIPHHAIAEGVTRARHPGRLEFIKGNPAILLDGAHNTAGATALRDHLELFAKRPLTIVFGCMQDKQVDEMSSTLFPVADQVVLTPIDNLRAMSVERLEASASQSISDKQIKLATSSREAMEIARAQTANGLICVTGSLYLIGEVRQEIFNEGSV